MPMTPICTSLFCARRLGDGALEDRRQLVAERADDLLHVGLVGRGQRLAVLAVEDHDRAGRGLLRERLLLQRRGLDRLVVAGQELRLVARGRQLRSRGDDDHRDDDPAEDDVPGMTCGQTAQGSEHGQNVTRYRVARVSLVFPARVTRVTSVARLSVLPRRPTSTRARSALAGRRRRRPRAGAAHLGRRGRAVVHPGGPDLAGERRRLHVPRRARRAPAAVPAPVGDGGGGRAQRLQGRSVGTAAAHQPLPRGHHLRDRGRRRAGDRARALPAPGGARGRRPRTAVRRRRPAPPALGARRGDLVVPRGLPVVRRHTAHRRRGRPLRPPDDPSRLAARRDRPAAHGRGARAGHRLLPARAGEHAGRPRGHPLHAAQPARPADAATRLRD